MARKKIRLDLLMAERFPQYSRQQIQSWIMQGKVRVDDQIILKAGTLVMADVALTCDIQEPKYVSRAGFKLEKALQDFQVVVSDLVCLDAGLSTGGFTDCLLQQGARKIFGVDVGSGQVHEKIRNNSRVVLLEDTNLRYLTQNMLGEYVDLVTLDLSFISVIKVMEAVVSCMKAEAQLIVLIKPQFEAQRQDIGRGGIVRNPMVHDHVIASVTDAIQKYGFRMVGVIESPITGATGNKEFLAYFVRTSSA